MNLIPKRRLGDIPTLTGNNVQEAIDQVKKLTIGSAMIGDASITTAKIVDLAVTDAKITTLGVEKLTAGTITSKLITLAIAAGTGDSYIAAGKSDFVNTDAGFILGLDDSDSDKAKFYIGDSTNYLNWTGTALNLSLSGGGISFGATGMVIDSEFGAGYFKFIYDAHVGFLALDSTGALTIQSNDAMLILGAVGSIEAHCDFDPASGNAYDLGISSTVYWKDLYIKNVNIKSQAGDSSAVTGCGTLYVKGNVLYYINAAGSFYTVNMTAV